ncbi:MAG TPA: tripartite tricarboxylate transporter substrate binding protein [Bordetella sp.]
MPNATFDPSRRRLLGLASSIGAASFLPGLARADDWPSRPIRLIVGYPPGGGTDTVARLTALHLSQTLGGQVIVDNRPGASGIVGTEMVAHASPDGYNILFATASPLTGAPLTVKNLAYDPFTDLKPVIFIGGGPFILVANPSFPPNTLQELVAYARAHPGEVNYASPGNSTADYFFCELLNIDAKIKTVAVAYKGSAALLNDVMGGYVQYTLDTPGTTLPLIRAGKLKAIAVLSDKRLDIAPDIPTAVEAGYPRMVGGSWYGMLAPKGTPDAIVQKLYQATKTAMASPEMVQGLAARDVIAQGLPPAEFGAFIKAEYNKWKEVTEKLGIQPQ